MNDKLILLGIKIRKEIAQLEKYLHHMGNNQDYQKLMGVKLDILRNQLIIVEHLEDLDAKQRKKNNKHIGWLY